MVTNKNRVVITGLGVVSPNGIGIKNFLKSIEKGTSGLEYITELDELGLKCKVAGIPKLDDELINKILPSSLLKRIEASNILYGLIAGLEAWSNANLIVNDKVDWDSGVIMGSQTIDGNFAREILNKIYLEDIRKLSARTAEQAITSSTSSYLSGYLGLGNCSISNSSACTTGTESIYMGYRKIKNGEAKRMLVGSSEGNSPFIWSTLDKLRVLDSSSNSSPEKASKPMSKHAKGLVPGCGAAALVLESLDSALERNAEIYGEIIGGHNNCGGQRTGGSMTNPNFEGMLRCIKSALIESKISPNSVDLISGHLTGTYVDPIEVKLWKTALNCKKEDFPYINSLKSMTGHCLGASGSIEFVAAILQLYNDFIHPSINCEEINEEILSYLESEKIPSIKVKKKMTYIAKANFGFGDLNTCLILKKYKK
ncbi:beta-ketoacyl-[acyl-carrier-protein] synthase family protein [Myroides odoratus]|uniref:beta-ketoacyl-[acyl-carrier-protein] synthase family protein n=1 Tax=Myroides odoratus TaxID=256 RepID=UPI0033418366